VPNIIIYSTRFFNVFMTNMLAPNGSTSMSYLCNNLKPHMLDAFALNHEHIINAACTAAQTQAPPEPEAVVGTVNNTALATAKNNLTSLYATLLACSATSDSQLSIMCAHAPEYVDNLDGEGLAGELVQSMLCAQTQPLPPTTTADCIAAARASYTGWFATVLANASDGDGWEQWLCEHLSVAAMDGAGLLGSSVVELVCSGSSSTG
jgi:hypothetical protein